MKRLFTTVDKEGNLIPTSGTYVLVRSNNEDGEVAVYSDSYKDGVAEMPKVYQKGDAIFVYPNGYVGASIKSPDNIELNKDAIADALQAKADAISSRFNTSTPAETN
jgi:hypothetical protein